MAFLCKLAERAVGTNKRIVLVEGQDERVREAAVHL
jgi:phosphotransacetylase